VILREKSKDSRLLTRQNLPKARFTETEKEGGASSEFEVSFNVDGVNKKIKCFVVSSVEYNKAFRPGIIRHISNLRDDIVYKKDKITSSELGEKTQEYLFGQAIQAFPLGEYLTKENTLKFDENDFWTGDLNQYLDEQKVLNEKIDSEYDDLNTYVNNLG
jgi:hypothetical protein